MSEGEDVTQETPTTESASEVEPDVEPDPAPDPALGSDPAPAAASRSRSYVRVPTWVAVVLAAVVLLGGGFVLGRATAPDDGDAVSIQAPAVEGREAIPLPRFSGAFLGVDAEGVADSGGAEVANVRPGSAADAGGLEAGDVITEIDGTEVTDAASLRIAIAAHDPGDEVTITYTRDGERNETTVELGDRTVEDSSNN